MATLAGAAGGLIGAPIVLVQAHSLALLLIGLPVPEAQAASVRNGATARHGGE